MTIPCATCGNDAVGLATCKSVGFYRFYRLYKGKPICRTCEERKRIFVGEIAFINGKG